MSTYWLPVIVLAIILVGARVAVWCCDPYNAMIASLWLSRNQREALHQQELRDIDEWLEHMWKKVQ